MLGLAIGIGSFIVILVYLNYELSYDKWDPSLKRVSKVILRENQDILPSTPAPLASLLLQRFPNADAATAVIPSGSFQMLVKAEEKSIYQDGFVTVDSLFLKVFPYQIIKGNPESALNKPGAVVISEQVSERLFGNNDPIGKPIKLYDAIDGVITAVMRKPSGPSQLKAEILLRDPNEWENKNWDNYSYETYLKLKQPISEVLLEKEINAIYYTDRLKEGNKSYEEFAKSSNKAGLISNALQNLHNFPKHGESHFKITLVLLILALFLLMAGAINFSNFSVARAINKAKEVGIRKVLGSRRIDIIIQSLLEISLQCFISLLMAISFVFIALPYFRKSFDLPLFFFNGENTFTIIWQIMASMLLIVLVSGLYPAIFLSHFETAQVLKGKFSRGKKGVLLRNSLLVLQLVLSTVFITGLLVINKQMNYMQSMDLGFNPSQMIRIEASQMSREKNFPVIRNELLSVPGVDFVVKSSAIPGSREVDTSTLAFRCAGTLARLNSVKVSIDYFKALNIQQVTGRLFELNRTEDADNTAIINESAARKMGSMDLIGQKIYFPNCDSIPYTIVGIIKDFHVQGFQNLVEPAIYSVSNAHCGYKSAGAILVRVKTDHVQQTLAGIESIWKKFEPAFPIRYSFLDQNFQNLFSEDIRLKKIIMFFTILSIMITTSGLFALTSFLTQQRMKEIGIRKVLGASVGGIASLLSKKFALLALLAICISTPIANWALQRWLEGFAYRIPLHWWVFVLAAVATISITLVTVCFQTIKAAISNPIKSLRTE